MTIRHIGYLALCDAKHRLDNISRIDLGSSRYRQLGVRELLKDEKPYRVCKRCLAKVVWRERAIARRRSPCTASRPPFNTEDDR